MLQYSGDGIVGAFTGQFISTTMYAPTLLAATGNIGVFALVYVTRFPKHIIYKLKQFFSSAATPPNAIAYGSGKISVMDMIKSGFFANIIGVTIVNVMLNTWAVYYFDLNNDDYKTTWAKCTS